MNTLEKLARVIDERSDAGSDESWTAKLLAGGRRRCAQKFGEEAVETALAGASGDTAELVGEAADTLYHLLVLLKANDVSLDAVFVELERRQGMSGIEEKRRRSGNR